MRGRFYYRVDHVPALTNNFCDANADAPSVCGTVRTVSEINGDFDRKLQIVPFLITELIKNNKYGAVFLTQSAYTYASVVVS